MIRCQQVLIYGFMLRDSPSWSVNLAQCEHVNISNMKHICWMRNSDGIDVEIIRRDGIVRCCAVSQQCTPSR